MATSSEHMTGHERLVLTSGGGDSTQFFRRMRLLAGKVEPRLLIDLSAVPDPQTFDERQEDLKQFFGQSTEVRLSWLQSEFGQMPSSDSMQSSLADATMLYVDNGNARRFKDAWPWWFRSAVTTRVREGSLVGAGSGAGALLWFDRGHSNARRHEVAPDQKWYYTLIKGLGVIPAWATTHWDESKPVAGQSRQERFEETLSSHRKDWHTAIGLDSAAILVCKKGMLEVMKSRGGKQPTAHVYRNDPSNPISYGPRQLFYP